MGSYFLCSSFFWVVKNFVQPAAVFIRDVAQSFDKEFFFALEMQVNYTQTQAGLCGDIGHGYPGQALLSNAFDGCHNELAPPGLGRH